MASIEFKNGSSSVKQIIDKAFQMTLVRHCGRYDDNSHIFQK